MTLCTIISSQQELNMAVVNHPNPPYLDADGNADWPDPEPNDVPDDLRCDCSSCSDSYLPHEYDDLT